jgi:hypothetical protein
MCVCLMQNSITISPSENVKSSSEGGTIITLLFLGDDVMQLAPEATLTFDSVSTLLLGLYVFDA